MDIIDGGRYDVYEDMKRLRNEDIIFNEIVCIIDMKLDEQKRRKKWYVRNVKIYIPVFPLTPEQKETLEMYLFDRYCYYHGRHLLMRKCKFSKKYKISSKRSIFDIFFDKLDVLKNRYF